MAIFIKYYLVDSVLCMGGGGGGGVTYLDTAGFCRLWILGMHTPQAKNPQLQLTLNDEKKHEMKSVCVKEIIWI